MLTRLGRRRFHAHSRARTHGVRRAITPRVVERVSLSTRLGHTNVRCTNVFVSRRYFASNDSHDDTSGSPSVSASEGETTKVEQGDEVDEFAHELFKDEPAQLDPFRLETTDEEKLAQTMKEEHEDKLRTLVEKDYVEVDEIDGDFNEFLDELDFEKHGDDVEREISSHRAPDTLLGRAESHEAKKRHEYLKESFSAIVDDFKEEEGLVTDIIDDIIRERRGEEDDLDVESYYSAKEQIVVDDTRASGFLENPEASMRVATAYRLPEEWRQKILPEGVGGDIQTLYDLYQQEFLVLRQNTLDLVSKLHQHREHGFDGSRTIVLDGFRGSGKSVTMAQAVMWARNNGWIAVYVKDPFKQLADGPMLRRSRAKKGLYDLPHLGESLCKQFIESHRDIWAKLPLKSRVRVDGFENNGSQTILSLLEYGLLNDGQRSNDVLVAFRNELNRITEYPVLLAIDNYNDYTETDSNFDDPMSDTIFPKRLKPSAFVLPSLFQNAKKTGLANGIMLTSYTHSGGSSVRKFMETRDAELLGDSVERFTIDKLTDNEFRALVEYMNKNELIEVDANSLSLKYLRALTSSRARELMRYTSIL